MSHRVTWSVLAMGVLMPILAADEGMWTFHNPPKKALKDKYGVELTQEWLDHVRLASVRFNSGGSGSFVSADGLVLTNHHVALDSIHKLSTDDSNLLADGFVAKTRAEELKVPDLELNVLVGMEDVTARVHGVAAKAANAEDAEKARKAEISAIEKEAKEKNGLRSNVVTLYQGGEYWLYQYKQFTDVRLVFAVDEQAAFFGGDPDNFTYPRWCFDYALVRAYENDAPYKTPHFLKFDAAGPKEDELVFVSGHPGRTERLMTMAQLSYRRDQSYPRTLEMQKRLCDLLHAYSRESASAALEAQDQVRTMENSLKANTGAYEGLLSTALFERKLSMENDLRARIAADAKLKADVGDAFEQIERAQAIATSIADRMAYSRLRSALATHAQNLVRYAEEIEKPNGERLAAFRDSSLDSLKLALFSAAPVHRGLEERMIRFGLELAREKLPPEDPFISAALNGKTPAEVAKDVVARTKLTDPAERQRLFEGKGAAIAASDDPMIALMRKIDPILRALEKQTEDEITAVVTAAQAKIAAARFTVYGRDLAPDATFTLRLSYGTASGYEEDTTLVPWKTTLYGLFDRALSFSNREPFNLSKPFAAAAKDLDLSTPVNYVSTCDIIGGNSGSPTINVKGDLVGLIFDGNIQSLPNNFIYANAADRAVHVHPAAILHSLEKVYGAGHIAAELRG